MSKLDIENSLFEGNESFSESVSTTFVYDCRKVKKGFSKAMEKIPWTEWRHETEISLISSHWFALIQEDRWDQQVAWNDIDILLSLR